MKPGRLILDSLMTPFMGSSRLFAQLLGQFTFAQAQHGEMAGPRAGRISSRSEMLSSTARRSR